MWCVIPGRRVAHFFTRNEFDPTKFCGVCCQTSNYDERQLTPASKKRRVCEQCAIVLAVNRLPSKTGWFMKAVSRRAFKAVLRQARAEGRILTHVP